MYQNYQPPGSYGNSYNSSNSYANQSSRFSTPSQSHSATSSSGQNNSSLMSKMDERSATSLLQHLGKDELNHLLENDSKLQDLINDLSQVKGIQEEHDSLAISNRSLAEYNLSLQPKLEDLKRTVASRYEEQNTLKTKLAEDKARLDSFVNQQSLDTLLALLQTETAKVEEESEDLTNEFLENSVEMEEYVNQFLSKRTTMHLRRIRSERMAELIRGGPQGMVPSTNHHTPYPPSGGTAAPYPTGPSFGMPQLQYR